jgi:hypothetical protein
VATPCFGCSCKIAATEFRVRVPLAAPPSLQAPEAVALKEIYYEKSPSWQGTPPRQQRRPCRPAAAPTPRCLPRPLPGACTLRIFYSGRDDRDPTLIMCHSRRIGPLALIKKKYRMEGGFACGQRGQRGWAATQAEEGVMYTSGRQGGPRDATGARSAWPGLSSCWVSMHRSRRGAVGPPSGQAA